MAAGGGTGGGPALAAWTPIVKAAVSSTLTALLLFVIAERQYLQGSKAAFAVLSAAGGAAVFLAIPVVHWVGHKLHSDYRLFQPFRGGLRFVVLQALSWTFYSLTAIVVAASVTYAEHTNGLLASAGVIGILSQVFMVSSLLTYRTKEEKPCGARQSAALRRRRQAMLAKPEFGAKSATAPAEPTAAAATAAAEPPLAAVPTTPACAEPAQPVESHESRLRRRRSIAKAIIDSAPDGEADLLARADKGHIRTLVREFVQMNTVLVTIGMTMALVSEHTQSWHHRSLYGALSLICCTVAVFLTYGIAGHLRHQNAGWSFAQAFRGGKEFVLLQIAGWCVFGIAVLTQGVVIASSIYVGTQVIPGGMYIGAFAAITSQYIIIHSIRHFKPSHTTAHVLAKGPPVEGMPTKVQSPWTYRQLPDLGVIEKLVMYGILALFCNMQFLSFACYMILFCLPYMCPPAAAELVDKFSLGLIPMLPGDKENFYHTVVIWGLLLGAIASWTFFYAILMVQGVRGWRLSVMLATFAVADFGGLMNYSRESPHYMMLVLICTLNFVYISTTFTKKPETNACREWTELREWPVFGDMFERFFGFRLELTEECAKIADKLGDENAEDPRHRQVMLLFHPHSIFPISHVALPCTGLWRAAFPNLKTNSLVASIIHLVPVMRDVLQWFGCCDVSRRSVLKLISMGRNVQIVCGGQTEMFESRSWDDDIAVVRRRRLGVFKIAIQQGLGIMPVFSFGETLTFDNIYMPTLQAAFKKYLGFPFPFLMLGKYYLPVPRRVPISVAIDAPVFPIKQKDEPTLDEIVELQTRYFDALQRLFDQFQEQCGHTARRIKWLDG